MNQMELPENEAIGALSLISFVDLIANDASKESLNKKQLELIIERGAQKTPMVMTCELRDRSWRGGRATTDQQFFAVTVKRHVLAIGRYRESLFATSPGMKCELWMNVATYSVYVKAEVHSVDVNHEQLTLIDRDRRRPMPTLRAVKKWLHIAALAESEQ